MKLACAVTTASRPKDYLPQTLASLRSAGFGIDIIAVDYPSSIEGWFEDIPVLNASATLGDYGNFLAALEVLVTYDVDAVAVFEDDILVTCGLRDWLKCQLWPDSPERMGVVSLYTPFPNHPPRSGWFRYNLTPTDQEPHPFRNCFGACGYLMPISAARRFLQDSPRRNKPGLRDFTMGWWCQTTNLGYWAHSPSLVEHVGNVSAITTQPIRNDRRAGRFVSDVRELGDSRATQLATPLSYSDHCRPPIEATIHR